MPVKISVEAIFGVTVVFHLVELYRAEVLMVIFQTALTLLSYFSLFTRLKLMDMPCLVSFKYQVQIQSLVDTCHHFTKKTLVLVVIEDIRVLQWNQQHQVSFTVSVFELI